MQSVIALLAELRKLDVKLWLEGEKLRYSAPKGSLTPERLEQIKTHKTEILEFLRQAGGSAAAANAPPLRRVARDQPLPLSFSQQRLWFISQLENGGIAYNMPGAFEVRGKLNVAALHSCFEELFRRHEALRTVFPSHEGQPEQQVLPPTVPELPLIDLQSLEGEAREAEVVRLMREDALTPFDLAQGPVFRATLLKLAPERHILLINMHHIMSDGWSVGIISRELGELYRAAGQAEAANLPPLDIQYPDYAVWQQEWWKSGGLVPQFEYWRNQLSGIPELLELPTDYPRPPRQSFRGAHYVHDLSAELNQALDRFSHQQGVSPFMTLLATFNVLLSRYSCQDDICVGTPIANRTQRQTENLIGLFANTLVLRTRVQPETRFSDLLRQTRHTCLGAYAHQDIPFEMLVEQLQPTRSLSHNPLFQVMLALQNNANTQFELPGLEVTEIFSESLIAKLDLLVSIEEKNGRLHCVWEYATDLFKADTIKRLSGHFEILLNAIIAGPDQAIGQLPLLTQAEIQQLQAWNDTVVEHSKDQTIVDIFEQQAETVPDNIAVVYENQSLTYRQLNEKANQLANYLLSLKTWHTPEITGNPLMAICVERSLDMVVGLLGILKAGGAYVPIDPSYPTVRIHHLLKDSAAPILLTHSNLKTQLPSLEHNCTVVCLDTVQYAEQPATNPIRKPRLEDLAYVIYTSGSTGKPKGCQIPHLNVTRLFANTRDWFHFTPHDVWTMVHSYSFDFSVWELWGALLHGCKLVIVPYLTSRSPADFYQLIVEQQVTVLNQTPSSFGQLVDTNIQLDRNALRLVVLGGEALDLARVQSWFAYHDEDSPRLINMYGPTEATVWATTCFIRKNIDSAPSIGRPFANTRVYILDAQYQPQPPGIPGELCIAGEGLARGYHNRPELTAEKFVEVEIFGQTERIYKTGDLARWLSDGNLEYLGRIDHQVKLRGFRIELGEIEALLTQHEAVREAVVVLRERESDKALAAYLTVSNKNTPTQTPDHSLLVNELRNWLKARLPDYMVPTYFTVLDRLPLTPNGKIDRKALPIPEAPFSVRDYQPPRNAVEQQLVHIWENLLESRPIGVQDNFFELGGHSLLAVRLMAHIEHHFSKLLPLATLFQHSTIEQLATLLHQPDEAELSWSPLVKIQVSEATKPLLFCIHPVGGNVLCYMELAHHLDRGYPIYGLESAGLNGEQPPLTTLEDMAERYVEAVLQVQEQGPYYLCGWSLGGVLAFEMASRLQARGQSVAFVGLFDSHVSFPIPVPDEASLIYYMAQDFSGLSGKPINLGTVEELRNLEPRQRLEYFLEQAKAVDLFSPETHLEHIEPLWQVFHANIQALFDYKPRPYPGKLTLFRASQNENEGYWDPVAVWRDLSTELEIYQVPGDHYSLLRQPNVQVLAEQLAKVLARAELKN